MFINLLCNYSGMNLPVLSPKYLPGNPVNHHYEYKAGAPDKPPVLSFRCRDIGMDCPFEVTGTTKNKIYREFIGHAESSHNVTVMSADLLFKINEAIKK